MSIRGYIDSLYLYRAFAAQRLLVNTPIGTRISIHCTAMGRMLLTALSDSEPGTLYQPIRLDNYPAPAPRNQREMTATITSGRILGWVFHRSDYSSAIASSVKDHTGKVTAAISRKLGFY
ncbi:IclR family transcriptional regulator domain-containing protein [Pseudomonas rhizophila]|uniref:IclR family transcriptional regulator domain-containing protein n=1 Tax=Pseudomonas rhizophila TaxID=2045200 RepID=UPI003BB6134F